MLFVPSALQGVDEASETTVEAAHVRSWGEAGEVTELIGHLSEATAYVVSDYPYMKKAKTSIRFWIEMKERYGQRFVSQVWNPARAGRWRTPGCSRYAAVTVLYLGQSGHVEFDQLRLDAGLRALEAFEAQYPVSCAAGYNQQWLFRVRGRAGR